MAICFNTSLGDVDAWTTHLGTLLPEEEIRVWPDVGDRSEIDIVIMWDLPVEELATFPNLEAILVLGAGANHLRPVELLPDVPIVRLVDDTVAKDMGAYVLHWLLHHHRGFDRYLEQESEHNWDRHQYAAVEDHVVGICGMGNIGRHIANVIGPLGYTIRGWSRSGTPVDGIDVFDGDHLDEFLAGTNTLVNVLPMTQDTRRLLDADRLAQLPSGAVLINVGRGGTLDDDALIASLDSGHLRAAVLDVFRGEPIAADSPFWAHPKVRVTPHISGFTYPRSAATYLAANIGRIRRGEAPFPLFDRTRGY